MNLILKIIKSIIKSIFRILFRRPFYFVKRNLKQVIAVYLLGVSPSNYLMTAATTQYDITQPQQIVNVLKNSGVANLISGGTLQPLKGLAQNTLGGITTKIGEITGSQSLIDDGKNMALSAKSWFDQGSSTLVNTASEANSKIEEIKSSATSAIESITSKETQPDEFDYHTFPDYYEILGLSHIDPAQYPAPSTIEYSELDELGRTRIAKATLTYQNVQNSLGKRGSFKTGGDNEPSGWIPQKRNQTVSIPAQFGRSYRGYFYNRSHLIADQLGGEAIRRNAITGTRPQNVGGPDQKGGMRYSEIKATKWLKEHKEDGILYYSAEPIYVDNELVARYVIVKMKSSDNSIDEEIKVFNTANGWSINYLTGEYTQK